MKKLENKKEDFLHWLEYVHKTLEGFVGIEKEKENFEKCYKDLHDFIRYHPEIGVCLTIRESKVLYLRAKKKSLEEIAKMFKVTRERIRQIEAKAVKKLERGIQEKKEGD